MTGDDVRHATPGQFEAARRFFRHHPRPGDRWSKWRAAESEEQRQDDKWIERGGNQ